MSSGPSGSLGCRCWSCIVVIGFYPNIVFHVTDTAVQSALSGVQTLAAAGK